jgi:enoyl-CoA hydratase
MTDTAATGEVLIRVEGAAGIFSLNRPKAIHALTLDMVQAMSASMMGWKNNPAIEAVIIDHAPAADGDPKLSRGFCAGGDIGLLRHSALNDGGASGRRFFHHEYRLNHLIFSYPKPVVAFMDGITMGGGVGISQPATFRVATPNTRLAMPETGIGLFPDVGGGWYLSRLKGRLGQYLALTGARFDGAECLWAGLATHYLAPEALSQAKRRIAQAPADSDAILREFSCAPPAPRIAEHADTIARLFASDRYEDILQALTTDGSEFAKETLVTLAAKSPQACKVALRQLAESRDLTDFRDNMAMEYRLASRVLSRPDFAEGVRAVIIDKDNAPAWRPATPEGVTAELIESFFAPLPAEQEWNSL